MMMMIIIKIIIIIIIVIIKKIYNYAPTFISPKCNKVVCSVKIILLN